MKKPLFYLIMVILTLLIGFLIFGNQEHQPLTEQEIQKLSQTFGDKFSEMRKSQQNDQPSSNKINTPEPKVETQNTQAIIGVIYKKQGSTWFIKAKDNQQRINQITEKFKQYFLTNLKFDDNQQPQFDHLPKDAKSGSKSSMRYATFMIDGIEVSVINLPGDQDTFSNVKRWMGQVGLNEKSPISMQFLDDKSTIFVKMPK
jgi:hypothetical protein